MKKILGLILAAITFSSAFASAADFAIELVPAPGSVQFSDIANKPATYEPSAHVHSISDITNLQSQLTELINKISTPTVRYSTATNQSIPNATITIINYNLKSTDDANAVSTGAGWKFYPSASGYYAVAAGVQLSNTGGAGTIYLEIYKNGVQFSRSNHIIPRDTVTTYGADIVDMVPMLVGDYLDFRIFHNLGGSVTLSGISNVNRVSIFRTAGGPL